MLKAQTLARLTVGTRRAFVQPYRSYAQEYTINRTVRLPKQRMYNTIGDVERYPEFVPYCTGCTVSEPVKNADSQLSERKVFLKIKWNQYEDGFESMVAKTDDEIHSYAVNSDMFTELKCLWRVTELDDQKCNVEMKLVYHFQNPLYNLVSKGAGRLVSKAMITAFLNQAAKEHHRDTAGL